MKKRIGEDWAKFEAALLADGGIGDKQRRAMRVAFYSGALCVFTRAMTEVSPGEAITEEDMSLMADIEAELMAFDEDVNAGRA